MQYLHPTSIRLSKTLKDYLIRRATAEDRKMASVIVRILEESRVAFLARRKAGEADKEQQK